MKFTFAERARARERLLEYLKPGDVVTTVLFHVSQSGMSRDIGLVIGRDREVVDITYIVAALLDRPLSKKQGIKIGGCGMDMGFALVYELGAALWPDGTPEAHGTHNGEPDRAGGYALKHRWL